jgi:hypothetical protein
MAARRSRSCSSRPERARTVPLFSALMDALSSVYACSISLLCSLAPHSPLYPASLPRTRARTLDVIVHVLPPLSPCAHVPQLPPPLSAILYQYDSRTHAAHAVARKCPPSLSHDPQAPFIDLIRARVIETSSVRCRTRCRSALARRGSHFTLHKQASDLVCLRRHRAEFLALPARPRSMPASRPFRCIPTTTERLTELTRSVGNAGRPR